MQILNKQGQLEIPSFEVRERSKARNEREEIIEYFFASVNGDRVKSGRKSFPFAFFVRHLQHVPTADLYPFWKSCHEYEIKGNQFSKGYFGMLKVRPVNKVNK